ncbi:MAG: TRAM domain-containing protein [Vicinamibacterales bacterium]
MISIGDVLPLTVEKPVAGGRMLARVVGRIVLVSGAIPGERVQARVERVAKGVVYAAAAGIDEASADRRPAADPLCGGCLYAHIAYPRQLDLKALVVEDAFARIGRLALPGPVRVAASIETGYRMRARLHVRGSLFGFVRESTHDICDVRQTGQLLEQTCDALDRLWAAVRSLGLEGVADIELAENLDASARVVHLNGRDPIDARQLDRLGATPGLTGLSAATGTRGDAYVTDVLTIGDGPPVALRRHVLAFFQGNRYLLEPLVSHVVAQLPPARHIVDLYAGVGVFAIAAATVRGTTVTAVEGDMIAAADLTANAAARETVVAVHQAVEDFLRDASVQPDAVIVDPPRTGLSREAMDGLASLGAPRIVYVSCDVATLARDARRLVDASYSLARVDAFDLFPNTPHVETVAVFDR